MINFFHLQHQENRSNNYLFINAFSPKISPHLSLLHGSPSLKLLSNTTLFFPFFKEKKKKPSLSFSSFKKFYVLRCITFMCTTHRSDLCICWEMTTTVSVFNIHHHTQLQTSFPWWWERLRSTLLATFKYALKPFPLKKCVVGPWSISIS